jgi:hypothetical protein
MRGGTLLATRPQEKMRYKKWRFGPALLSGVHFNRERDVDHHLLHALCAEEVLHPTSRVHVSFNSLPKSSVVASLQRLVSGLTATIMSIHVPQHFRRKKKGRPMYCVLECHGISARMFRQRPSAAHLLEMVFKRKNVLGCIKLEVSWESTLVTGDSAVIELRVVFRIFRRALDLGEGGGLPSNIAIISPVVKEQLCKVLDLLPQWKMKSKVEI